MSIHITADCQHCIIILIITDTQFNVCIHMFSHRIFSNLTCSCSEILYVFLCKAIPLISFTDECVCVCVCVLYHSLFHSLNGCTFFMKEFHQCGNIVKTDISSSNCKRYVCAVSMYL